jgi:fatty acid desaturase/cytochrome b involved in lipid metabolism
MCRSNSTTGNATATTTKSETTMPTPSIASSHDDDETIDTPLVVDIASSSSDSMDAATIRPKAHDDSTGKKPSVSPMTRAQVLKCSDPETLCLMIVACKVYDCTRWQHTHPGGFLTIRALCGKDATDSFMYSHPKYVRERMLDKFYYADLKDDDGDGRTKPTAIDQTTLEFRELTRKMEEAGLFKTNYAFYYRLAAVYAGMFLLVVAGVLYSENPMVHALSGALLGLFWQQMAFIGHDLGHNAISGNREIDSAWGLVVGNLMTGVSMAWWKRSHNVHHIVTNSVDYDPDIQHLPLMAVDPAFIEKPIFSTYQGQYLLLNDVAQLFIKVQHWLYYPIMAAARINLYVQSIAHALCLDYYAQTKDLVWHRELQIATLAAFWTWLTALTMQLPTWQSRVLFLVPAHVVAGILHVQITISHFAMPVHSGVTYDDSSNGYILTQLRGTMDIDCPTYLDWFHGGIQFQVVHHLWPRLPRHNLRHVKTIFMAFCQEHDLEYKQLPFLEANRMVIDKLRETAKCCKAFSDIFADSMNLNG